MPRIPLYQQQVQPITPQEQTPNLQRPIVAGEAINASNEAVRSYGEKTSKAINLFSQRIAERAQMEAETNIAKHDAAARIEFQNLLYDKELDIKGVPKGYLQRNLDQTPGSVSDFDNAYEQLRKRYIDSVSSDYQKSLLGKSLDNQYAQNRGLIIRHEANEGNKTYNLAVDTDLKLIYAQASAITDPKILTDEIERAQQMNASRDHKNGVDPHSLQLNKYIVANEITKSAINGLVEQNYIAAQSLFDKVKNRLLPIDQQDIQKTIDGKALHQMADNVWEASKGNRLSDGTPNMPKIKLAIDNLTDLDVDKRDRLWTLVQDRANEDIRNMHMRDRANDNAFNNQAIQSRQDGKTLDETMKLIGAFGKDNYDKLQKEDFIRKLYAPSTASDPSMFMSLWEGVRTNKVGLINIDAAFNQGLLNTTDYRSLRETFFNQQLSGENPIQKAAWERVKILARDNYFDEKRRNKFLYEVKQFSKDKTTVDEIVGEAERLLKPDKETGALWDWTRDKIWETTLKKQDEQRTNRNVIVNSYNIAWDKLKLEVGEEELNAIGREILISGKSTWGIKDVDDYAQALGGYTKIKFGTPVNNAIRSLYRKGERASVNNVKAVLIKYPDGNIP